MIVVEFARALQSGIFDVTRRENLKYFGRAVKRQAQGRNFRFDFVVWQTVRIALSTQGPKKARGALNSAAIFGRPPAGRMV